MRLTTREESQLLLQNADRQLGQHNGANDECNDDMTEDALPTRPSTKLEYPTTAQPGSVAPNSSSCSSSRKLLLRLFQAAATVFALLSLGNMLYKTCVLALAASAVEAGLVERQAASSPAGVPDYLVTYPDLMPGMLDPSARGM